MNEQLTKSLVEMSLTTEQADGFIEKRLGLNSYQDKIEYLDKTFNFEIKSRSTDPNTTEEERLHDDYFALLTAIINAKWE